MVQSILNCIPSERVVHAPEYPEGVEEMEPSVLTVEPCVFAWKTEAGLTGLIFRNQMGCLNGYIGVPHDRRDYDNYDARVHGGLTFSGEPSWLEDPDPSLEYVVGFDTAHGGDLIPHFMMGGLPWGDCTYRDFEYVFNEVEFLAKQFVH
jgi:hypothetical protein